MEERQAQDQAVVLTAEMGSGKNPSHISAASFKNGTPVHFTSAPPLSAPYFLRYTAALFLFLSLCVPCLLSEFTPQGMMPHYFSLCR